MGTLNTLEARNAASSFLSLAWLSLLSLLMVPLYIRLLGVTEWGMVAACASLQVVSNFIDAGFSQIVPRWAAQEAKRPARLLSYITVFRRVYIGLGLLVFVALQVGAGFLSHDWFQAPPGRAADLELAIRIVSFQFLFQFINNLHIGLWYGLQKQMTANVRGCIFASLKHATAATMLIMGPAHAWIYALAFSAVALLEVVSNALKVKSMLGSARSDDAIGLGSLLREVSVLSGGILIGVLVSQLDRVVLSRTVDVASFGIYTVIATLALAFLQLQAPVARAYFPLLVQDLQERGHISPKHFKRLLTGTVVCATIPALLSCALAPQLLSLWLRDAHFVASGAYPLRLLLTAVALNSIYGCIYQVIIASGQSKKVLEFNIVSLAGTILVVTMVGTSTGIALGGAIWLCNASIQLVLGTVWLFRNDVLVRVWAPLKK